MILMSSAWTPAAANMDSATAAAANFPDLFNFLLLPTRTP